LIVFGAYTGFRITELLSLNIQDVFHGGSVAPVVRVAKGFMKGQARSRSMPLHQRVRDAIGEWIEATPYAKERRASCFALFPGRSPRRALSRRQAANVIQSAARRAGVAPDHVSTHSLRKSV
jgi:integrase/recombinase XerD